MKKTGALFLLSFLFSCQQSTENPPEEVDVPIAFLAPDELYGQLFSDVQTAQVFPDGKTFLDCEPNGSPVDILEKYLLEKKKPGFNLETFVRANFKTPAPSAIDFKPGKNNSISGHINSMWPMLTRQPDEVNAGSLIPLPRPYIVSELSAREVYYWESYFTMLGLQAAGRNEMVENMVDNFAYLIDTVGYVPFGNRTYYIGRSQPPFFELMVGLLAETKGERVYQKYLPQLKKEYAFWMDGVEKLEELRNGEDEVPEVLTHRRVVQFSDGSVLNRYWDDKDTPRPEHYREDMETAKGSGRPAPEIYRDLRAASESGWEMSSRWLADGQNLQTVHTTDIVPVDLNTLLYNLEFSLAKACEEAGDKKGGAFYIGRAKERALAIQKYCWHAQSSFFTDYDFVKMRPTGVLSLAGIYPLFFHLATPDQAARAAEVVGKDFLKKGGVISTLKNTDLKWDAPNGQAGLQWMTKEGLRRYGYSGLAKKISERWILLNKKAYKISGKTWKEYEVEKANSDKWKEGHESQVGHGCSNGVLIKFLTDS